MRHRHDHKRQQKKIERVQRPPEKTGDKRVALITVEKFKKPDRFHSVFQLFAWLLYRKLESQEAAIARESDSSVTRRSQAFAAATPLQLRFVARASLVGFHHVFERPIEVGVERVGSIGMCRTVAPVFVHPKPRRRVFAHVRLK